MYDLEQIPENDRAYVLDSHRDVSRTFDLALGKLSRPIKDVVCVDYLLCRIPDTIEDSGVIPTEDQVRLLDEYTDVLRNPSDENIDSFIDHALEHRDRALEHGEDQADWELVENTDRVFNVYDAFYDEVKDATLENVGEMTEGMKEICRRYPEGIRIGDTEEFEEYCFYVAGTVGNLLTDLFSEYGNFEDQLESRLYDRAEEFGEALQTVNIVKDIRPDYLEENAIFIPESVLYDNNVSHEELERLLEGEADDPKVRDSAEDAVTEMAERSQQNLQESARYIHHLPDHVPEIKRWSMVSHLLATATLRKLQQNPGEALTEGGISISKNEALTIYDRIDKWSEQDIKEVTQAVNQKEQTSWKSGLKIELDRLINA